MKKLLIGGFLFLAAMYLSYLTPAGKIISAEMDFNKIASNIYADPEMSKGEISRIQKDLKISRKLVNSYFGELQAAPTIIFIKSPDNIKKFGNVAGQTYDTFLGDKILFGPKGYSKEIIAHELVHAELRSRLPKNEIPAWFDEGIATFIDGRFQQEISNWKMEEEEIVAIYKWETQKSFRDTREPILNRYKLASCELNNWYKHAGREGLSLLIKRVNAGEDFLSAYKGVLSENTKD